MDSRLEEIFDELETLRNDYFSTHEFNDDIYKRVVADKWSVGEVIYHCYLLLKITRQLSEVYIPLSKMYVHLFHRTPKYYDGGMENIYAGETMKAPFILVPDMKRRYSKGELRLMLESETDKLKQCLKDLNKDELYWIRYPDPVPGYPNIIQTMKVAKIHEAHHYKIVLERVRENR